MKRAFYHIAQSCLWVLATQFVAIGIGVAAVQMMISDPAMEMLVYLAGVLSPVLFALSGFLIPRSFMVTSRKQLFAFVAIWLVAAVGFDTLLALGYIVDTAEFICLPQQLTAASVFQSAQPDAMLRMGIHLMTIIYFGVGFWFKRRRLKRKAAV